MRSRRIIAAFVEIESINARMWRQCSTGDADDTNRRRVLLRSEDGGYGEPRAHYWCAADKPATDEGFAVAPVYRSTVCEPDAVCEVCGVNIREIQLLVAPQGRA